MAGYVQMFNGNQPFKNGSYIYGKINKEIVPVYYTGGKTDSIQIIINNEDRIISANLTGSVKNPINDATTSEEYTWSSQKISEGLTHKPEIVDEIISTDTVWSSEKISQEIDEKLQVQDNVTSTETLWSSEKTEQTIQSSNGLWYHSYAYGQAAGSSFFRASLILPTSTQFSSVGQLCSYLVGEHPSHPFQDQWGFPFTGAIYRQNESGQKEMVPIVCFYLYGEDDSSDYLRAFGYVSGTSREASWVIPYNGIFSDRYVRKIN